MRHLQKADLPHGAPYLCHDDLPDERRVAGNTLEDAGAQTHHHDADLCEGDPADDRPGGGDAQGEAGG